MGQFRLKSLTKQGNTYSGRLVYDDDANYIIYSDDGGVFNLSNALSTIYYHPENNHICIKVMNGSRVLFDEDGVLYKKAIGKHFYSYHVSSEDLETVLFYAVDKFVEVALFAEALEEIEDVSFYRNKK